MIRKFKIEYAIGSVDLEGQGEWNFSFDIHHSIVVDEDTTIKEIHEMILETELKIYADRDEPYEDGYTITYYEITSLEEYFIKEMI